MASGVLDRLRSPAYTGENRCWPCTVLNVVIVLAVSVPLGVFSPPLGVVSFLGGLALVALRGYVVPYTPTFAPRLVSWFPVDLGFTHPQRADGGRTSDSLVGDETDGDALVRQLVETGVVAVDESGDLLLSDEIRRTWEAGMRRLRDVSDAELAASTASAAPFPAEGQIEGDGDWVVVTRTAREDDAGETGGAAETIPGNEGATVWLTRAHAIADTAAVAAVSDHVDAVTAAQAATPLRLFLETCPVCGGPVEETVVRECCGGTGSVYENPETPVLACADCGEFLYEF